MKILLLILCLSASVLAEEAESAATILAFARNQLPSHPVHMSGSLKERSANNFVKRTLSVEMDLHWGATIPAAHYEIKNEKADKTQSVTLQWRDENVAVQWLENGEPKERINLNEEIDGLGVTWADLSFSFLWDPRAKLLRSDKKLGKECHVLSIPRPESHELLLWIEKKTGRLLGAEEMNEAGKRYKIIKVVSVKDFDGLWMVKDLDIINFSRGGKTTLRVDSVTSGL